MTIEHVKVGLWLGNLKRDFVPSSHHQGLRQTSFFTVRTLLSGGFPIFPFTEGVFLLQTKIYTGLGCLLYLQTWAALSTILSALNLTKIFREKASFHIHLSPCFYSPFQSQNSFLLASLAMQLQGCIFLFLSSILAVSKWKDHSGYQNYHTTREEHTFWSPPPTPAIPLLPHIKQLLAVFPQNSLNKQRSRGRRGLMGVGKVKRPVGQRSQWRQRTDEWKSVNWWVRWAGSCGEWVQCLSGCSYTFQRRKPKESLTVLPKVTAS